MIVQEKEEVIQGKVVKVMVLKSSKEMKASKRKELSRKLQRMNKTYSESSYGSVNSNDFCNWNEDALYC